MAAKKKAKNKGGRPTSYKKTFADKMVKFFDIEPYETTTETFYYKNGDEKEKEVRVARSLPFLRDFAKSIGVAYATITRWAEHKDESCPKTCKRPEFCDAYKESKVLQEQMMVKNALCGLYNATFSIFTAKNMFGWRDDKNLDITSGGKSIGAILDEAGKK